jgi:hypothetical protein
MRNLPVFATFKHAVTTVYRHKEVAFKISRTWFALLLFSAIMLACWNPTDPVMKSVYWLTSMAFSIISVVAYMLVAVSWQRFVLLNEMPNIWLGTGHVTMKYFGNLVLALAAIILLLIFVYVLCIFILAAALSFSSEEWRTMIRSDGRYGLITVLFLFLPLLIVVPFNYRLLIKIAAIAVGRSDFSFYDALKCSRWNYWRLLGLFALKFAVSAALFVFLSQMHTLFPNSIGLFGVVIKTTIHVLFLWLLAMLGISINTSLYGFFAEQRNF